MVKLYFLSMEKVLRAEFAMLLIRGPSLIVDPKEICAVNEKGEELSLSSSASHRINDVLSSSSELSS